MDEVKTVLVAVVVVNVVVVVVVGAAVVVKVVVVVSATFARFPPCGFFGVKEVRFLLRAAVASREVEGELLFSTLFKLARCDECALACCCFALLAGFARRSGRLMIFLTCNVVALAVRVAL